MRPLLLFACISVCSAFAASHPAPFPKTKIETPVLSLLDAARQKTPAVFPEPSRPALHREPMPLDAPRLISKMPVVPPRKGVDYKLRIARPDESVDYKMRVERPRLESAK